MFATAMFAARMCMIRKAVPVAVLLFSIGDAAHAGLLAGAAKVDITHSDLPANDRLHVRALVVRHDSTTAVLITVDAVAIGEIGPIKNDYLGRVRTRLEADLKIPPQNVAINASHCHGIVCSDVAERTVQAVNQAVRNLVPVHVGAGAGHEDRIQENRRLTLKSGKEIDIRHAYSMPADEEVAAVGPIDPQIGILRLDRQDGRTLAVVYNFACHPIQGVPSGGNTADITGFSSQVIEDNLDEGTVALFVQGCGGDINPIQYKDVNQPNDAEPLGNLLALSTLKALRKIRTREDARLSVLNERIELPRANLAVRIDAMQTERERLTDSLRGTFLNLQSFLPLVVKYRLSPDFPSDESHRYLHEKSVGRERLARMDSLNRSRMQQYIRNIRTMEQLTRINTNLRLLRRHQADLVDSGRRTIDVELVALRVGDFVLTTFPGELTVQIGQNIKSRSPHELTFVAGYTNGYIYYAPTAEQLRNVGNAQEDSDCLLAPEWQALYEKRAIALLRKL